MSRLFQLSVFPKRSDSVCSLHALALIGTFADYETLGVYQEAWDMGNGFRFMFGTFCDITYNREANEAACNFIRSKIKEIVKDPETARKLTPWELYARRPLCDGGYYQIFNQDNVEMVLLKETPIKEFDKTGITTSDGKHHDLDVIIFATGFDAMDANYMRVSIRGRGGESLQEHWVCVIPNVLFRKQTRMLTTLYRTRSMGLLPILGFVCPNFRIGL